MKTIGSSAKIIQGIRIINTIKAHDARSWSNITIICLNCDHRYIDIYPVYLFPYTDVKMFREGWEAHSCYIQKNIPNDY